MTHHLTPCPQLIKVRPTTLASLLTLFALPPLLDPSPHSLPPHTYYAVSSGHVVIMGRAFLSTQLSAKPREFVYKTVDCFTRPGSIQLVHDLESVVVEGTVNVPWFMVYYSTPAYAWDVRHTPPLPEYEHQALKSV